MGMAGSPRNKQKSTATIPKPITNHGFLMNLPPPIIAEILARLPVRAIFQCKSVCKQWYSLITHPYFAALHFSTARPGLVIHHSEIFKKFFRIVDLDDSYDHPDGHLPHSSMLKFDVSNISTFPDADIVVDGSVHGLLFLRDINYRHETLYVCNPVTGEYITLPGPRRAARYPSVVTHGFGVARKSGEYKIVRIFHERVLDPRTHNCIGIPFTECLVYTLGMGVWRRVGAAPFGYDSRSLGLFFQGNVHWLIEDLAGQELISCFDLGMEVFQAFPAPFPGRKILGSLGIFKDCLCLCDNTSDFGIDIWVMREYGVQKSWNKEIVISKTAELVGPSFHVVSVVKVFSDGKILLLWGDFFMFYYCTKTKMVREVDVNQPVGPNSIEAMNYVPTFLSLAKIGKEHVCMF